VTFPALDAKNPIDLRETAKTSNITLAKLSELSLYHGPIDDLNATPKLTDDF